MANRISTVREKEFKEKIMSKLFEKLLREVSLDIRLKVALQMEDEDNWENGEYLGNQERLVTVIMEIVKEWKADGASLYNSENPSGDRA